jgi:thimet oligopeptidase
MDELIATTTKSGIDLDVDTALAGLSTSIFNRGPDALDDATRHALDAVRALVSWLKAAPESGPLDVLTRYDDALLLLGDAAALASVCRNGHPELAMRDAAERCEQEIDAVATEVTLDRGVYEALSRAAAASDQLDEAGRHLLDKTLKAMRKSGVDRDEATRTEVRKLRDELVTIAQEFDKNIISDVRGVDFTLDELDGLPADYIANHAPGPDGKVRVTTDSTDFVAFITYAKRADARERLWREHRSRAQDKNIAVLERLLGKRRDLARALGYPSYAALETEDKMIGTADHAASFIEETAQASRARGERDYATLLERKRVDTPGAQQVDGWDAAYLSDRVSEERYGFSSQTARPYLEYSRVVAGVLDTMTRIFSVHFRPVTAQEAARVRWHEQVDVHDVVDDKSGKTLGRIYLDMHARDHKYKHYAQFTVRSGVKRPGRTRLPEGALLCNFPDPQKGLALLDLDQMRTFLHEFGHLMHHILGGHVRWAGVSGVATEWDFVEAPSQLLEEWAWDHETVARFAKHHETDEPMPRALLDKAREAESFGKGLWVRQQMFYAALSLEYHRRDPSTFDTTALLAELQARYTPYAFVPGTAFQASFGHLASYSAVYYTYMWSLVIAKDLFSRFRTEGMVAPAPTADYRREVLEQGGGKPAAQLCEAFLGRPYAVDAFRAWLDGN